MSLRDEIVKALPDLMRLYPKGPLASEIAVYIASDVPHIRSAMDDLEENSRVRIVRRGRAFHVVPLDYPGRTCLICRCEFVPVAKKTVTCSYSCARHLAWRNEDMRARHKASVIKSRQKPGLKEALTKRSREYWSDPENRKAASELQRQKWQDPVIKGRRLVGVERAWSSPERQAAQAERRLKDWKNPNFREKTIAAMRTGKRGIKKRRTLELAVNHPDMTPREIAEKTDRLLDNVLSDLRIARRNGVLGIRPGDGPRLRKKAGI